MRLVTLENAYNFRDLGGYATRDGGQTRRGMIYRSATLCRVSEQDRLTLRGIGLKTAVDLREAIEHQREGKDELGEGIQVISMPTTMGVTSFLRKALMNPKSFRMVDFYLNSFDKRAAYQAKLFRALADPANQPVVVHCTAGKDRTGVIVALLLRVAGVSDQDIIADYAETTQHLSPVAEKQREGFRKLGLRENVIDELLSSYPETMQALLAHLDQQFGSAEAYLIKGGLNQAELDRFRTAFVAYP